MNDAFPCKSCRGTGMTYRGWGSSKCTSCAGSGKRQPPPAPPKK